MENFNTNEPIGLSDIAAKNANLSDIDIAEKINNFLISEGIVHPDVPIFMDSSLSPTINIMSKMKDRDGFGVRMFITIADKTK